MRRRIAALMFWLAIVVAILSLWGSFARAQPHNPPLTQNGPVQLWPYQTAAATALTYAPTFPIGGFDISNGIRIAPVLSVSGIVPQYSAVITQGSVEATANPTLYIYNTFRAYHTMFSNTNGVAPLLPDNFVDQVTVEQRTGASSTVYASVSNLSQNTHQARGGDLSLTGTAAVNTIRSGVYQDVFQPRFCAETGKTLIVDQVTQLWMKDPDKVSTGGIPACASTDGTVTVGQVIPIDVQRLTAGTSNMSFRFAGETNFGQHHGKIGVGGGGACSSTTNQVCTDAGTGNCAGSGASCSCDQDCLVTPSARLHVSEPVLGDEVFRVESFATNDDVAEKTYQCRQTTTDATQSTPTTLATCAFPVTNNKVLNVQATVVAHCTAGASCTANNGAAYRIMATCKNNGGTTGAVTGSPDTISVAEDVAGWDITIDCDNTVDKARIRVTGAATTTITWQATVRTMEVGT